MKPYSLHYALLIVPALLAVPPSVLAAEGERQLPVFLRADRIDINQKTELSVYRGHVVFSQGTFRLTAARAEVQNRANQLETVTAEGKPTTFRYRPEGTVVFIEGEANRAVYHALTRQVDLYDNVQLQRNRDLFRSATMHYDIENQRLVGEGASGRRVYAALMPQTGNKTPPVDLP